MCVYGKRKYIYTYGLYVCLKTNTEVPEPERFQDSDGEFAKSGGNQYPSSLDTVRTTCGNVHETFVRVSSFYIGEYRVLIAAAGPFAVCGEPLVSACVRSGTDYLDITGKRAQTSLVCVQASLSLYCVPQEKHHGWAK